MRSHAERPGTIECSGPKLSLLSSSLPAGKALTAGSFWEDPRRLGAAHASSRRRGCFAGAAAHHASARACPHRAHFEAAARASTRHSASGCASACSHASGAACVDGGSRGGECGFVRSVRQEEGDRCNRHHDDSGQFLFHFSFPFMRNGMPSADRVKAPSVRLIIRPAGLFEG